MSSKESLLNKIWITRISRVNAEKRLLAKENYFQILNIYYSCVTIAFSIVSLLRDSEELSIVSLFMTISILVVMMYVASLKFSSRALDYRHNYTELQKLELELELMDKDDTNDNKIEDIAKRYVELLDSSENHITFDYYKSIANSNENYRKEKYTRIIKRRYYVGWAWRIAIVVATVVLPFLLWRIADKL